MSDAEAYLQELRRALPLGCRRRLVSEVREHFASAVAAEAEKGVARPDAERLTVERLGPAQALADQLLSDLRSGALGRRGRLAVAVTPRRLAAVCLVIAAAAVAGAVFAGKRSSPAPAPPPRTASPTTVVLNPRTGEVRYVLLRLQTDVKRTYSRSTAKGVTPWTMSLTQDPVTGTVIVHSSSKR